MPPSQSFPAIVRAPTLMGEVEQSVCLGSVSVRPIQPWSRAAWGLPGEGACDE